MKYFILLFILSCSSNFNSNLEKKTLEEEYYENGQLEYQIQKNNNKIDGYAKYWNLDGQLINEVNYSNGIFHGNWKEYHSNGKIKYLVSYNYGLKEGYEYFYYDNGIKKSETYYESNQIIVETIRWDDTGKLIYK